MRRTPLKRMRQDPLDGWRNAVLARDHNECRLRGQLDACAGPHAAHHVVFRSRDASRSHDVDNGATLCRRHHDWVHANSAEARTRFGLAGHAEDRVLNGRVVITLMEVFYPEGEVRLFDAERQALAAARPKRST